jgi:TonB family protein
MKSRLLTVALFACTWIVPIACSHSPAPPGATPSDKPLPSATHSALAAPSDSAAASGPSTASPKTSAAPGDVALPSSSASAWNNAQSDGKSPTNDRNIADYMAIVQGNRDKFRTCYEASLSSHPGIKGRTMLRFVLSPGGTVKEAGIERSNSDITEADLERCLVAELKKLSFPPSKRGMETTVNYPFHFNPRAGK